MEDPVMDQCAHTFERHAILGWLDQHESCPISRKPMTADDLLLNHTLAERIDRWQWERDNVSLLKQVADGERNDACQDVEQAGRRSLELRRKYEREQRDLYPIFMLLPQEEAVLKVERLKEEELERDHRRQSNQRMLLLLFGMLVLSYIIINKLVFENVEEENQEIIPIINDDVMA